MKLFSRVEVTTNEEEQIRLMGEIIDLNEKNLWIIGTVGQTPSIYLVKDTFVNVPEVALSGWSVRTPGNTAVECYAIDPSRAGARNSEG